MAESEYLIQISNEEKAAVIGYWRSGATIEQICQITGYYHPLVEKVIYEYQKGFKKSVHKV